MNISLPHEVDVLASTLLHSQLYHPHTKLLDSVVNALLKITKSHSTFTVEALTTTLYSIDIELILDAKSNTIAIPDHWKSWKNAQSLLQHSHFCEKTTVELEPPSKRTCTQSPSRSSSSVSSNQALCLASDWAEVVGGPGETLARRVAVEIDGPWHYAANCPHTLGKTLLKHRVLRCLGWRVISVSYHTVHSIIYCM